MTRISTIERIARKHISQNLRYYSRNISIKQLSKKTQISASTISNYIYMRSTPTEKNLKLLAKALEVNIGQIDPRYMEPDNSEYDISTPQGLQIFSVNLRQLLAHNFESRAQLSKAIKVSLFNINVWITAKVAPSPKNLVAIAEHFNVPVAYLTEPHDFEPINPNVSLVLKHIGKDDNMTYAEATKIISYIDFIKFQRNQKKSSKK